MDPVGTARIVGVSYGRTSPVVYETTASDGSAQVHTVWDLVSGMHVKANRACGEQESKQRSEMSLSPSFK